MARRRKKSTRRSIAPLAVSVAVFVLALLLFTNVLFVVRDVQVVGAGEVPEADVRHMSGIRLGSRIWSVDPEKVRQDVESDGRVAFVSLHTRLPNTVVLEVRPRSMDAVIVLGGKILALDSDGYVVAVDEVPETGAVYVTGLKASYYTLGRQLDTADGRIAAMKTVVEALKARGATGYVSELNVTDTADLRVLTRTGMTVLLGDTGDMLNKVAWMAGALADLEARGETTGQLDVSSGTKADYAPPAPSAAAEEEEPEPEAAEAPAGQVYSIDGVIYVDGQPVDAQPTEQPAS